MRRAETWKKVARAPNPKWVTTRSKKEKGGNGNPNKRKGVDFFTVRKGVDCSTKKQIRSWLPVQKLRPRKIWNEMLDCKSAYLNTQCDPPNFPAQAKIGAMSQVHAREWNGTQKRKEGQLGKLTLKHQNGGWQLHDLAKTDQEASSDIPGWDQCKEREGGEILFGGHLTSTDLNSHGIVYEREREGDRALAGERVNSNFKPADCFGTSKL
jgi:hypothetical protein